jgi:peptidoglycan lytic transglycosylase
LLASARANAYAVVLLLLSAGVLVPSSAAAATGGGGLGPAASPGSPGMASTSTTTPPASNLSTFGNVQPGNGTVTASGNGISIASRGSAILLQSLRFTGTVPATAAGQVIEIQRRGHETSGAWTNTAHATAKPDGSFAIVWHANHIGRFQFRAVIGAGTGARAAAASPSVTAIVYRPAIATWYSLNGSSTACGETLRPSTLGVANRTLPCGTMVAFYYQGRTIVVPVIDRGPYANHADWDLTEATAKKLGTLEAGIATIGAVSLPG